MTEVDGAAGAAADGNDLPGVSATVGGGSGNVNSRQGRMLTGKEWELAQPQRPARCCCRARDESRRDNNGRQGDAVAAAATTKAGKGRC